MFELIPRRTRVMLVPFGGQRGITGLETAIVLIAFVVVSSVFAFAALSTGLFSADKVKETISAGLAEARGSMELRGAVILEDTDTDGKVDKIYFQVANAAGGEAINLTQGETIIKYSDPNQTVVFDTTSEFSVNGVGNADSDLLLEPGEIYEIALLTMETNLGTQLVVDTTFIIEVLPPQGAVLFIERRTPVALDKYNDVG